MLLKFFKYFFFYDIKYSWQEATIENEDGKENILFSVIELDHVDKYMFVYMVQIQIHCCVF